MNLSTSDTIQILGIISSLVTSITAIFISVISIRQNSKNIEESTRPYIVFYVDQITINNQKTYFAIKNFGASPGIITSFQFVNPPDTISKQLLMDLNRLQDIILAPGQSKLIFINSCLIFNPDTIYTFIITYKNGKKIYTDKYDINIRNYTQIPTCRPSVSDADIAHSLREIIERMI